MAKQTIDNDSQFEAIRADIEAGIFAPVYLLFGKEHYYIDQVCNLLMQKVIPEHERDFGQIVVYGLDTNAQSIVSAARQYPMMASRQLIVVKEAQMMDKVEDIGSYFANIMPSTVLVICYKTPNNGSSTKNIDKRSKFYKEAGKVGVVMETAPIQDYKMAQWIERFVPTRGYSIEPAAAALMAEHCGTDIGKVALEIDKLGKILSSSGEKKITVKAVEENVGMSRDFSAFELTKALSFKDAAKAYKITTFFAQASKRFPIQLTMAALTSHFLRLMKYHAGVQDKMNSAALAQLIGVNPYFMREYETAARNYPVKKTMKVISLLREYDHRSKSNLRGNADDGELLKELVSMILNA